MKLRTSNALISMEPVSNDGDIKAYFKIEPNQWYEPFVLAIRDGEVFSFGMFLKRLGDVLTTSTWIEDSE